MTTNSKKKILIDKIKKKKDKVQVASQGSFPASDAPSHWASGPKPKLKPKSDTEKPTESEKDS